jgi:ABC-type Zn uptake system ZnuABC Zn-binding protein ZnuA
MKVKAIFISVNENSNLAQRISTDTGAKLVSLFMESLSASGGEADTYIDFMQYDVKSIVSALQ